MKTIALIIMVAIVLEGLVEYGKTIDRMIVARDYKTAITQGITIVLGIALAFIFHLQLFNEGMSEIYKGLAINPTIDMILTGILFSRGSNYFSDFVSKLQRKDNINIVGTEYTGDLEALPDDDFEDYMDEFDDYDFEDDDEVVEAEEK